MRNTLYRWLLYLLCRRASTWWGVWRLDLPHRVLAYRFPEGGNLLVRTKWGQPIEIRKNEMVSHVVYFFGELERKLRAVAAAELRPGDATLDIGANIGAVSLFLGALVGLQGRVYSVEPFPQNFELLEKNLRRVDPGSIFRPERCALGAEDKTIALRFDPRMNNLGAVSLLDQAGNHEEPVALRRLDTLWEEWGRPRFRFVKMDVEGYEYEVMRGAERLLREAPPEVWVVEFNWEHLSRIENGVRRQWDIFIDHGYEPFHMNTGGKMTAPPTEHCDVLFRFKSRSAA